MQSTGQASTQAVSFVPMQGSAMTYAMKHLHVSQFQTIPWFGAVSSHVLLYATPPCAQLRRICARADCFCKSSRFRAILTRPPKTSRRFFASNHYLKITDIQEVLL